MSSTTQRIKDLRDRSDQLLEEVITEAGVHVFQAAMVAWTTQATDGQLLRAIAESNFGTTEELTSEIVMHPDVLQAIQNAISVVTKKLHETYSVEEDQ